MKKIFILLSVMVTIFCMNINNIFAKETKEYPYYIKSYNIDLNVNDDYTVNVTETIKVEFNKESRGFVKYIPSKGYYVDETGNKKKYSLTLENLTVNDKSKLSNKNEEYVINIYSDKAFDKEETFIIKYDLKYKSLERILFLNIIDTRWSSTIENAKFNIKLPKVVSEDEIFITRGNIYSTDTNNIIYEYEDNTIKGKLSSKLDPYEGIRFSSYVATNYFNKSSTASNYDFILIFIMFINVIFVYVLWYRNGKDYITLASSEYYPINDYNSLEFAYIKNECKSISDKEISSLVIYLANKGFIKIERDFNKITLIKRKNYNKTNEIERVFMRELFKNGNTFLIENGNKEYRSILKRIKKLINTKENKLIVMEEKSLYLKIVPMILGILNVIITLIVVGASMDILTFLLTVVVTSFGFYLLTIGLLTKPSIKKQIMIVFGITLIVLVGSLTVYGILNSSAYLLFYYIIGMLFYSLIVMFVYLMPKRSKDGNILYSNVINFKKFILSLNEDMIKTLYKTDKNYFYNVFAYAYALDIEEDFIKKYEKIYKIELPKWYEDKTNN